MTPLLRRWAHTVLALVVLGALAGEARAAQVTQALPEGLTPEAAARLLQQNPQLFELVRQRVLTSGLSPEELHARLATAGYPPELLDPYLYGGATTIDPEIAQAISLLGVGAIGVDTAAAAAEESDTMPAAATDTAASAALPLFGLAAFREPTTQFEAATSGPVDDSYVVGAGDVLVAILSGAVENSLVLEITKEGFVVVPRVGQVFLANLTLGQARELLLRRLRQVYSGLGRGAGARTTLDVVVARIRVQSVRVIGEVHRPGTYPVSAAGGVLAALYAAGGPSVNGSFRRIELHRGSTLVGVVDLYDYLLGGTVSTDFALRPGDVVFVPVHGPRVKIAGEVHRPAVYEVYPGETLRDLVRLAGGLTPYAATGTATIYRVLPPGQRPAPGYNRTVVTAGLTSVLDSTAAPVPLAAADSVAIHSIRGGRRAAVDVAGSVWQPGSYALAPGARLWDLIGMAGGLRPDTYGGRIQILRTFADSTTRLMGYAVPDTSANVPADDPLLVEGDHVTVFARTDFRERRHVMVRGAVRRPGAVQFADSMTLRDAVLLAGGLTDDAYLAEAEVSRLADPMEGRGNSLAIILRVPLDSSYVVDETGYVRRPVGQAQAPPFVLHPYDNIFVRHQPGFALQRNVVLTGEVRFPGVYTLTSKDERLSAVVRRAGGLTPDAYPEAARFFRQKDDAGRMAVDLPAALKRPAERANLILEAGDSIYVPRFIPLVYVMGAVNQPTSVTFVRGAGVGYYIQSAGGYTARADKGRTYIEQPNGHIVRGARPEAGATITVPQKDPTERSTFIQLLPFFSAIVQAATAAATLIVALRN